MFGLKWLGSLRRKLMGGEVQTCHCLSLLVFLAPSVLTFPSLFYWFTLTWLHFKNRQLYATSGKRARLFCAFRVKKPYVQGVPIVAQHVQDPTYYLWGCWLNPWPLAVSQGSGIAPSCGVVHRCGSNPVLPWQWCRLQLQLWFDP